MLKRIKDQTTLGDVVGLILFAIAIVVAISVDIGIRYGPGAALLYAVIFSLITGFLIVINLLF